MQNVQWGLISWAFRNNSIYSQKTGKLFPAALDIKTFYKYKAQTYVIFIAVYDK